MTYLPDGWDKNLSFNTYSGQVQLTRWVCAEAFQRVNVGVAFQSATCVHQLPECKRGGGGTNRFFVGFFSVFFWRFFYFAWKKRFWFWKIPHFWPQFPQKSSIFWPTNCIFYANEKFANGAENFLSPPQHEVCSASWGILKDFPCNLQFFLLYPLNYFLFLAVGVIFWGWGCSTPYPSLSTPGSTPPHTADHVCLMHTLFMSRAKRLPFFTNVYATYSRVLCCFLSSVLIIHIRMLTYLLLRPFVFFIVSSFRSRCWELLHHFVLWLPSSA